MCDTFTHSEMSVSKFVYLTITWIALVSKVCNCCQFWNEWDKIIVKYNTKWVVYPAAHPVWEPNVWYIRTFWDERLKIDNPYRILFTWVSQVCNCRQLFSECVKFIVKYKAKWVMTPTARPLWEPNVWYSRTFCDGRLKIDIPYNSFDSLGVQSV